MLPLLIPAGFVVLSIVRRDVFARRKVTGMLLAPACVVLVAFYSLAVHMYLRLDGWPRAIGTRGFAAPLVAHAEVAQACFHVLVLALFVWPLPCLLAALAPRARPWLPHLGVFGGAAMLALGLTQLAPAGFLYWWWD